jgi:hypothetical protein
MCEGDRPARGQRRQKKNPQPPEKCSEEATTRFIVAGCAASCQTFWQTAENAEKEFPT